jgi:hypothetical protein
MQGPIEFVRHIVATLLIAAHAVLALVTAQVNVVAHTTAPVAADVRAEATTSPSNVFPVATSKTAATSTQNTITTVTKPEQNPVASSQTTSEGSAQAQQQSSATLPPALSQSDVNSMARAALVNIVCTSQSGGVQYFITGSGVLVSGTGVILTNAHAAQYFLLNEGVAKEDCVIRTGSPAQPTYHAELLYLPPAWITANAKQITADVGTGTGEHDYAFLRITGTTDPRGTVPTSLPHLPLTLNEPERTEPILIASYPAGYLKSIAVESNLYQSTAITTVQEVYAFDSEGNADIVSLGSPIVAQAGSSGGGVVRMYDGAVQAIVAIATEGASTNTRELRGITLSHIDRSLRAQGMGGLVALLSGDLKQKAADFAATTAPAERQQLLNALKK